MRSRIVTLTALCTLCSFAALAEDSSLGTTREKFSYTIGLQIGQNLSQQGLRDVDAKALALAIEDVLAGRELRLSIEEMQAAGRAYQQEMMQAREATASENKSIGEQFLAENKDAEGVTELDSGLQYKVVEVGDGEKPTETDTVLVNYRGRLLDGTEFDSSYRRGQPTELTLNQVIPGWQQALQLMPVGSRWEIWVPAELAYGANGAGGAIGPNETLFFEIELIEIKE